MRCNKKTAKKRFFYCAVILLCNPSKRVYDIPNKLPINFLIVFMYIYPNIYRGKIYAVFGELKNIE